MKNYQTSDTYSVRNKQPRVRAKVRVYEKNSGNIEYSTRATLFLTKSMIGNKHGLVNFDGDIFPSKSPPSPKDSVGSRIGRLVKTNQPEASKNETVSIRSQQ